MPLNYLSQYRARPPSCRLAVSPTVSPTVSPAVHFPLSNDCQVSEVEGVVGGRKFVYLRLPFDWALFKRLATVVLVSTCYEETLFTCISAIHVWATIRVVSSMGDHRGRGRRGSRTWVLSPCSDPRLTFCRALLMDFSKKIAIFRPCALYSGAPYTPTITVLFYFHSHSK